MRLRAVRGAGRMCRCAGGNDAANFQGDWILTSGTVDGQEATEETLAQAQEMDFPFTCN